MTDKDSDVNVATSDKAVSYNTMITSAERVTMLAIDVYASLFGKPIPAGKSFQNEEELFREVSKDLANPNYSFEKTTRPQCVDQATEEKIEDYIVRAYYNSNAFANRAARSLGYNSPNEMPEKDRAVYDKIIQRGHDIEKLVRDDSISDDNVYSWDEEAYSVHDERRTGDIMGISVVGHEMGHFLYNGHQSDGLVPGLQRGSMYSDTCGSDPSEKYGKENSPLNTINEDSTDFNKTEKLIKSVLSSDEYKESMKSISEQDPVVLRDYFGTKDAARIMTLMNIEHDNAGIERGADVHGARLLMLKEGIWNPFDGSDVNEEQINQLEKKYPQSRIFNYWDKEKSCFFLNNLADSQQSDKEIKAESKVMLTANVGGQTMNFEMSGTQYTKMMAMDDSHRIKMISSILPRGTVDEMADDQKKALLAAVDNSLYNTPSKPEVYVSSMVDNKVDTKQTVKPEISPSLMAQANFTQEMEHINSQSVALERSGGISV